MDLENIKASLAETQLDNDVLASTFYQFSQENPEQDLQGFAAYLHKNQQIDARTLNILLREAKVEISEIQELKRNSSEAQAEPVDTETSTSEELYDIIGKVGEGAMGEILLAKDQDLKRTVAYKKMHPKLAQSNQAVKYFLNEIQITAQLEHPNVVPIYNLEVAADGSIAYSMKLIQGKTFKELIEEAKQGQHAIDRFLEHYLKVCDALEYAHSKGVIHRDLKPENIMVGTYNEVVVMDWGIACVMGGEMGSNEQLVGTPLYMSPEQAAGKNNELDGRSDQYSMGLILQELLTLKPAYKQAKKKEESLQKIINAEREPIQAHLPHELEAIIDKATQRDPNRRYASLKELGDDIRRYLNGEAVLAKADTTLQKILRWIAHHGQETLTAIVLIVLISISTISYNFYRQSQKLLLIEERQEHLQLALSLVNEQSNQIDKQFLFLEGLLNNFGKVILQRLNLQQVYPQSYYTKEQFLNPTTGPNDIVFSKGYGLNISPQWASFIPDKEPIQGSLTSDIELLHPLQNLMRNTMLASYGKQDPTISDKIDEMIVKREFPLIWVYAGFESGFHMEFPGTADNYAHEYDPRVRPWYKAAKKTGKTKWLKPFYAIIKGKKSELDVPCVMPLYDKTGNFRGVAAIDMTLSYMKEQYLNLNYPGILSSRILDAEGKVIMSSLEKEELDSAASIPPEDKATILQAIQSRGGNFHDKKSSNGKIFYAYFAIPSQNWIYVVEAQRDTLLEHMKMQKEQG